MEAGKTAEDYLEAILIVKERQGYVRSIDVAEQMNVAKPSVTYSTKRLVSGGYLTHDSNGMLVLTDKGNAVASETYKRHRVLTQCFIHLGVDPTQAAIDACKVEHDISQQTFDAICRHAGNAITASM